MTIARAFTEELHKRGTGAQGGQFVAGGAAPAQSPAGKKAPAAKKYPKGSLAFNGRTGPGYGKPNGDAKVHKLQDALNKLGFTDGGGSKLKGDGKLGPRTTAAIKKAQRALGLKADGVVTPDLLSKLTKAKSLKDLKAKSKPVKAAKKAAPSKAFTKQAGTDPAPRKAPTRVAVGGR